MESYYLGKQYLDHQNYEQAEQHFREGLLAGDIRCSYGMLALAASQKKDCTEEIGQLRSVLPKLKAMAEGGDPDGNFILGRCYETGSVVEQDIPKAMQYYTRAASKGNLDAMHNLGCLYMQMGQVTIAKEYFTEAAKAGHLYADNALAHLLCGE